MLSGVHTLRELLGASRVIIGVESNKPDAIRALREIADNSTDPDDRIRVLPLRCRYPQGAEKILVQACTGRVVPQGGLPADSLCAHAALMSAFENDVDPALVYAQQAYAYARPGDVFLGLSTSGNAENVRAAAMAAKIRGAKVIALTGEGGGKLAPLADCAVRAPERETYRVQECHLAIYHFLCAYVESELFDE